MLWKKEGAGEGGGEGDGGGGREAVGVAYLPLVGREVEGRLRGRGWPKRDGTGWFAWLSDFSGRRDAACITIYDRSLALKSPLGPNPRNTIP